MSFSATIPASTVRDFASADAFLAKGRTNNRRKLANNTYLIRSRWNDGDIAVRLHHTDIVTYHRNGTETLDTKGWRTVTTASRISAYSNARVSSIRGQWVVSHASDPLTPPNVKKCRTCHGKLGEHHTRTGEWNGHEWVTFATPMQVWSECYRCKGTGMVDYGSERDPLVYKDGIRVSSKDGHVINGRSYQRYSKLAVKLAEQDRVTRRAQRAYAKQRAIELAERVAAAQRVGDGETLFYKGVTKALKSPVQHDRELAYLPGTVINGHDFTADPGESCGAGINFYDNVADAYGWACQGGREGLVLAITIPAGQPFVKALYGNKYRAASVRVVGPVPVS